MTQRKRLLLRLASDHGDVIHLEALADQRYSEVDIETDIELLKELVLTLSLDREANVDMLIDAWFRPLVLLPEDQERVGRDLRRLGSFGIVGSNLIEEDIDVLHDGSPLDPNAYNLIHDPLIAEYGALPAPASADERAHIIAEAWMARAGDVIPGYDESRIRDAFRHDVLDGWSTSPFETASQAELHSLVFRVLESLTEHEEQVLRMRFGIGERSEHTREQVGRSLNTTRERIRQIESKALRKLRHPSRSDRLRPYLVK